MQGSGSVMLERPARARLEIVLYKLLKYLDLISV